MSKPDRQPMTKKLAKLIQSFLKDRRLSDGGNYAAVEQKDMDLLRRIILVLIEAKCQPEAGGDYPIEYELVNRRTHRRMHYYPVPHDSGCHTGDCDLTDDEAWEIDEHVEQKILFNLDIAIEEYQQWRRLKEIRKREHKEPADDK